MRSPTPSLAERVAVRSEAFVELSKLRIASLVLVSTAVGALLAARALSPLAFLGVLAGTLAAAGGANALNQVLERRLDARMRRTAKRPLPTGRLTPSEAAWFGVSAALVGVAVVGVFGSAWAAALTFATVLLYVAVYTPLKRITPWSTWVGAVPGALPPLIGAAAADGGAPTSALWLFAVVFFWQVPHFYAIAWRYREDYRAAGFPMRPVVDRSGRRTGSEGLAAAAAMVLCSLLPTLDGSLGLVHGGVALVLGVLFVAAVARFARRRSEATARGAFVASILYLPCLFAGLMLDRLV